MKEIFTKDCCLRQFVLSLLAMVSSIAYAYDIEVEGIYYNYMSIENCLSVTYPVDPNYHLNNYYGDLIIPSSVEIDGKYFDVYYIDNYAFDNCTNLNSIVLPESLWGGIGSCAFRNTNISSIVIPESVTYIGGHAFQGTKLTSIIIPENVKDIRNGIFRECHNLTSIIVDSNNKTYDSRNNCNGIVETNTNTIIAGCSKTIIPNNVTSIGEYAFDGLLSLETITIPNSVSSIGTGAFRLTGLKTVVSEIVNPFEIPSSVFEGISVDAVLQVPKGTKSLYQNCPGWTNYFSNIIEGKGLSSYALSVRATGGGSATYNGNEVTASTSTFVVEEGTSAIITFIPDIGHRIKSVMVNSEDVTSSVINDKYTITINSDTTVEVEFEAEPDTSYYSLYIKVKGNGSASLWDYTFRDEMGSFSVVVGSSLTIIITPDNGYRIKSVRINNEDVTSRITNNKYSITVNTDITMEVMFEAIPDDPTPTPTPTTYTLSITALGNGSANYGGDAIRRASRTYSVNEGSSATITFSPDIGYRIKSLKVNGSSVTVSTSYTTTINSDTSIEIEFEAIPDNPTPTPTSYTLTIKAIGNGSAHYGGETIRGTTKTYTVNEGAAVTISFIPDDGYRIESVKENGANIGDGNSYSKTINANTTVEVVFEAIPVTTYTLTVIASGNGVATIDGTDVRDGSQNFTVNEGSDAIVSFTPDKGYIVEEVKVDGSEVEVAELYTISDITSDKTIEVAFAEMDRNFSIDGVSYLIESFEDNTVTLTGVQNTITLEVSVKVNYQAQDWNIIGISENALENSEELAAIIWNPEIPFTAKVANPNLLLYVKDEAYAPAGIRNVVVNGFAKAITLTDAQSGNNFYCPSAFMTQSIIYTHNYSMKTGINESKGWETIALPFDVQQISHSGKGEIIPFAKWNADNDTKPFWLYELKGTGFVEAEELKANTPYIISMPNNDLYLNEYQLSGRVTFSALNAEVKKSDDIQTATFGNNTFVPAFTSHNAESGYYALNVNNDFETYQGSANVGSKFILNLRRIHPFEAYMTSTSGTRSIDIFDSMTTGIRDVLDITDSQKTQKVYDLSGRLIMTGTSLESIRQELPAGVYIINNKKMIIK